MSEAASKWTYEAEPNGLTYSIWEDDDTLIGEVQDKAHAKLICAVHDLACALQKTLPALIRLGDFIGDADRGAAAGVGHIDRLTLMANITAALEKSGLDTEAVACAQLAGTAPSKSAETAASHKSCTWTPSQDPQMPDTWESKCGVVWTFTDGGPAENGIYHCMKCGCKVQIQALEQAQQLEHEQV